MPGSLDERNWTLLLHRIKEGRCTPFLGAGAAFKSLPLGSEIAAQWSEKYHYPLPDGTNLPRVAQYLAITYDAMFPKEQLAASFRTYSPPDFDAPGEPHGLLARLPLPIYITTNYDDLMVQALKSKGFDPVQEACRWKQDLVERMPSAFDKGYVPSVEHPVVYHLHGHVKAPLSMVLTEDDYLDFLVHITRATDPNVLHPRIQEAFSDSTLLFLGYGLADWDFRVLFRTLIEYLQRSSSRSHVSVQLLPVPDDMSAEQKLNVQRYFDTYFGELFHVHVFWGTCHEFLAELGRRWDAYNARP